MSSPAAAHQVAIAAPHPAAVAAGHAAVQAGGSVVDAALAAAAALTVAYPHQCALGGDLVALVRTPDGTVRAVLSIGAAAAATDVAALRAAGPRMPAAGPQTVTVPGLVAGWAALAGWSSTLDLARLDLATLVAPATALARDGVPVSPGLARAIRSRYQVVRADPGLAGLLLDPAGAPLPAGATLYQPALADTLQAVGADWRTCYTGPVAAALVAGLRRLGSALTTDDFAAHQPEWAAPLQWSRHRTTWSVAPPPSQGATLLAMLAARDRDPGATGSSGATGNPGATGELLTTAVVAGQLRDALLGDPQAGPVDVTALLLGAASPGHARRAAPDPAAPPAAGDTAAVTAVAGDGSAVTLIQSVFQSFGAGILEPETGIVLHNRGSAFPLDPDHPGRLRPGARPPHTLCPALATGPGTALALGCQGGRAQPWILAQVADVAEAAAADADAAGLAAVLARPRWVIGARDLGQPVPSLVREPGVAGAAALADSAADLGLAVVDLPDRHDDAGHVQVARLGPGGLAAATDPRADGAAQVLL